MSEFAKKYDDNNECNNISATGVRDVCLCLPVNVTPDIKVGNISVKPMGRSEVSDYCCGGREETSCSFTISQKLRIEVPVEFGVNVSTAETYIDCNCNNCDNDDNDW
ncbi:MAG: hypothetical protein IKC41_06765 [Clostridia bacterium]|nr:hypothetical protein [Clostridia bacterium]